MWKRMGIAPPPRPGGGVKAAGPVQGHRLAHDPLCQGTTWPVWYVWWPCTVHRLPRTRTEHKAGL
jgi:hypothetical protein